MYERILRCWLHVVAGVAAPHDEQGMTTAELLGNAALAILALVGIWAAIRGVGTQVTDFIKSSLPGS
ncbi:MAG: hypothetical protein JWL73_583 [Actinomycetia bacterium]|nr:hypothetical protein [Actinomycetes bacterium]